VFFPWYNDSHRHSGIGYMTPTAVHQGHPSSTPNPVFPVFCPLDPNKIKHLAASF